MYNSQKEKASKIILSLLLAIVGIAMVLPIAWMISSSFKFESDVFIMPMQWIPKKVNLLNYVKVITETSYLKWYLNTASTTIIIVAFTLVFSSLSGYAFAKLKFKGADFIFFLFIGTLMIPTQVRIIPQFMMFKSWGLINSHAAIVLPWAYNGFSIFLMRQFFMSIPDELIEAARIDGSSDYRTFAQIVMPLAAPSLVALAVLSFTWGWNQYFAPLIYISDSVKQVLSVGIASFKSQYASNFAAQMAGATLGLVPVIAVYLAAQKYFIEGIALSGVKG